MAEPFEIRLDGNLIQSVDDLFSAMSSSVGFELARNFDALDDYLQGEIPFCCGPFKVVWEHANKSDWSGYQQLTKALGVLFWNQQLHPDRFLSLELQFDADPDEDTWSYPQIFNSDFYRAERGKRGIDE